MIEVEHLTKYYGSIKAVDNVTFRVEKGEILGFLGPNGAGKTTTMRIITCFLPATAGTVRVAGYDVFEEPLEVRRRIGYLPEEIPLYPEMTVTYYLDFFGRLKGVPKKVRPERVEAVIESCGLEDRRHEIIGKLSKGYRQRVGLAQALLNDPEVLVLDEPTLGLDPRQIIEIRQLIKSLKGEHTIILSSHILPEVSMVCDRVVVINEGQVVAEDTPENLAARLRRAETIRLEVRGPTNRVAECLQTLEGVRKVQPEGQERAGIQTYQVETELGRDLREAVAKTLIENGFGLLEMRPVGMTLEEIFLRLTTEEEGVPT
ncbi:MAG TPA: ATP-binding cassette domain-containing protein [Armatimonadetes bacterium]|nr:ATP-binding cassette domain-containing protein [Armatimonadota bacterium]